MTEETKEMDTNKPTLQIQGTISEKIPVLIQIYHDKYNPEKITTVLILLSKDTEIYGSFRACLSGDEYGTLKIVNDSNKNIEICIIGIHGWSIQENKAELNAEGYEYCISESAVKNAKNIYIDVELTPSGILQKWGSRELHFNGSIKHKNGYSEEIEWDIAIGKVKAFSHYTYEERTIYDNKATLQIKRPTLFFDINTSGDLNIKTIKEEIEKESNDICLILSLCYRRSVNWYEMNFVIIPYEREDHQISPVVRKKIYRKTYPDRIEELINHRDLINNGLSELLKNFRNSPLIDSLRRSIAFLASSQSNLTIEIKYFLTVISLESFCDGFVELNSGNIKFPSGKWKKIENTIRESLKELSANESYSPYIERVKKKLPELKGVTTFDKIIHCCKSLEITVDDLWQKDGLEKGLNKALSMRNHLFHRAYYDDPYILYTNQLRLQIMTERLILKHLNWPVEKIWRWYDQDLRWAVANE